MDHRLEGKFASRFGRPSNIIEVFDEWCINDFETTNKHILEQLQSNLSTELSMMQQRYRL